MYLSALFLAITIVSPADIDGRDCDSNCVGILKAATQWAVAKLEAVPQFDRSRTFLDITSSTSAQRMLDSPDAVPEEDGERIGALTQIARQVGIKALDAADDAGWRVCIENRPAACRSARGTTIINVNKIEILSNEKAVAWITLRTLNGRTRAETHWSGVYGAQLHVGRVDGEWTVVGEGITGFN